MIRKFIAFFFKIRGRLNRSEYVTLNLFLSVTYTILSKFLNYIFQCFQESTLPLNYVTNPVSFSLLLIVDVILLTLFGGMGITLCIRRLHDLNRSGIVLLSVFFFFIFLNVGSLIATPNPSIGIVTSFVLLIGFQLYLFIKKGTPGPNKYGPESQVIIFNFDTPVIEQQPPSNEDKEAEKQAHNFLIS